MEGFTPMICGQCGGKTKAQEGTFKELEGGGFFYFGSDIVKCESCGTEYTPHSQIKKFVAQVVMAPNSVFVGGDVVGSNIIIASGVNTNRVGRKKRRE